MTAVHIRADCHDGVSCVLDDSREKSKDLLSLDSEMTHLLLDRRESIHTALMSLLTAGRVMPCRFGQCPAVARLALRGLSEQGGTSAAGTSGTHRPTRDGRRRCRTCRAGCRRRAHERRCNAHMPRGSEKAELATASAAIRALHG